MIFADTNFFIALAKPSDRLQERAKTLAREHAGEIYTSRGTLLELLVISHRFDFDRLEALAYALEIAPIPEDEDVLFQTAELMDEFDLTAFDAYCVAYAADDSIISSDNRFDEIPGVDRIRLEPADSNA